MGDGTQGADHHGPVWLKAPGPGTAFEVGLYELLERADPNRVLTPIAGEHADAPLQCLRALLDDSYLGGA